MPVGGDRDHVRRVVDQLAGGAAVREDGRVRRQQHLAGGEEGEGAEILEERGERRRAAVDLHRRGAEPGGGGQGLRDPAGGRLGHHQVAMDQADLRRLAATGQPGEESFDGFGQAALAR